MSEKEYLKTKTKKTIKEITYLVFITFLLIFSIFADFSNIECLKFFYAKVSRENTEFVIMQIQVMVVALFLTTITLVSGTIKDTIYGIPINQYVMHLRRKILKYKYITGFQVVMLITSFISMSFNYYNILVGIFLATTINSVWLMFDVFWVLLSYTKLNPEIKNYLLHEPNHQNIDALKGKILNICANGILGDDSLEILKQLANKQTNDLKADDAYVECLNTFLGSANKGLIIEALVSLKNAYKDANSNGLTVEYFQEVWRNLIYSLSYLDLAQLINNDLIGQLQDVLPANLSSAYNFSVFIYLYAVKKNNNPNANSIIMQEYTNKIYLRLICGERLERVNMIKILIDNNEKDIIEKSVFNWRYYATSIDSVAMFEIMIYLYYLAKYEEEADEKVRKFADNILLKNKDQFCNLIQYRGMIDFSEQEIKELYATLKNWEMLIINGVKSVIYRDVVDDFLTFSALATFDLYDSHDLVSKYFTDHQFEMFNRYFNGQGEELAHDYSQFCNTFGLSKEREEINFAIDTLWQQMSQEYKKSSIADEKSKQLSAEDKKKYEDDLTIVALDYARNFLNVFNTKIDPVTSIDFETDDVQFSFVLRDSYKEQLIERIRGLIIYALYQQIRPMLIIEKLSRRDLVMPIIKKLAEKGANYVLIGRDFCIRADKPEYEQFTANMKKITNRNLNNVMAFVDSNALYLAILEVAIYIKTLDAEAIINTWQKELSPETGLYRHTIVNNLKADFTESELIEFEQVIRSRIVVSGKMDSASRMENVGFAIEFEPV